MVACALALAVALSPATWRPAAAQEVYDPLEPMNRAIYGFNDVADRFVLEPVARGYRFVAPVPVRRSVSNFLANLRSPVVFANDLLQGEREKAGTTLGRFMINSTLGVFGLFDFAGQLGYARHDADLGQTLGLHGTRPGAYLMLPLLGPSNLRDAGGRVGDFFLDPLNQCCVETSWRYARFGSNAVSQREANIEVVDDLRANAIDPYATIRTVYSQRRAAVTRPEGAPPTDPGYDEIFEDPEQTDAP